MEETDDKNIYHIIMIDYLNNLKYKSIIEEILESGKAKLSLKDFFNKLYYSLNGYKEINEYMISIFHKYILPTQNFTNDTQNISKNAYDIETFINELSEIFGFVKHGYKKKYYVNVLFNIGYIIKLNIYSYYPDFIFSNPNIIHMLLCDTYSDGCNSNKFNFSDDEKLQCEKITIDIQRRIKQNINNFSNEVLFDNIFNFINLNEDFKIYEVFCDDEKMYDIFMKSVLHHYSAYINFDNIKALLKYIDENKLKMYQLIKKTTDISYWEEEYNKTIQKIINKLKQYLITTYKTKQDEKEKINKQLLEIENDIEKIDTIMI